jgi:hypothetical protein
VSFLDANHPDPRSGAGKSALIALVFVIIGLGAAAFWFYGRAPAPEPETTPAPAVAVEPAPPPKTAKPPRVNLPTSGSLVVSANVDGAAVFLDGESVGTAPFANDSLAAGNYAIKVTKDGYRDFVSSVRIRAGKASDLRAALERLPPTLRITSDVDGATVFMDRNYVGTTPVDIKEVDLGQHDITVSADGYDMYVGTVEIEEGHNDVRVDFVKAAAVLNERVSVIHKHSFGDCSGLLVADMNGIRYETEHKDAFSVPFASLERFEVDYIKKNMNLKVRNGRNLNFTEQSGNADALFVFHKNVQEFLEKNQ